MLPPIMSSNPVSILALPRYVLLMQAFLPPVESLPNPGEPPAAGVNFFNGARCSP
ncbi:predicted protein [Brucella sp. 83/13]|nr:predicted protein [Brucella sp. 83/13]